MFCDEEPREAVRYVMRCHVLHAHHACPVAPSSIGPSFLEFPSVACEGRSGVGAPFQPARPCPVARPLWPSPGLFRKRRRRIRASCLPPRSRIRQHPACRFLYPVSFHSVPSAPSPAGPCGGTLIRAYPARAPAPAGARFAPARFARLIARVRLRARAQAQGALCPLAESGAFFAPARNRSEAASGWRLLPPARFGYSTPCVKYKSELLQITRMNKESQPSVGP